MVERLKTKSNPEKYFRSWMIEWCWCEYSWIPNKGEEDNLSILTLSVLSFLVQVGIGGGSKVPALDKTTKNNRFGIKIGTIIEGP